MSRSAEIRERIRLWLEAHPPTLLPPSAMQADAPPETVAKAGILPFIPAPSIENWRVFLMLPREDKPHLGSPGWQICKGKRMYLPAGAKKWRDMRDGDILPEDANPESLAAAALREGDEEIGIDLEAIRALYDLGPYPFRSASSGKPRVIWLFAAAMAKDAGFAPLETLAKTTQDYGWFTSGEYEGKAREDHALVVSDMLARLPAE